MHIAREFIVFDPLGVRLKKRSGSELLDTPYAEQELMRCSLTRE